MPKKPSIFISYSSKNKKIADYIDTIFQKNKITLTRDIRDVAFKESFKEFMQKIRNTKFAILVISDDFLKSRNCMFEVIEFLKEQDFDEKFLPVVLEDVSLDPVGKTKYLQYWENEYERLKKEAESLKPEDIVTPAKDLRHYKHISMHIGDFLDKLSDIRFEPYKKLEATDFKILFDEINKRAQHLKPPQVKILAITASPKGSPIFYEKEQDVLLESIGQFDKEKLFLDIPDPVNATLDEIKKYLKTGKHDILQITAHGTINNNGEGALVFEDAKGGDVKVTGAELAKQFGKESTTKIVILSSCHSARPEEQYLTVAETLHEAGIPAVIGMRTKITHDAAIHFNTGFYTGLIEGQKIKAAYDTGIAAIKEYEDQKRRNNPNDVFESETDIPVLLTSNPELSIADFSDTIVETPERPKSHTFKTNYMERGFIGRRDIIRKILKRVNERQTLISLKGPGGIGKSTLTSRVMADLIREGYDFIEFQGRIEPSGVIDSLVREAASTKEEYKHIDAIITKTQDLPEKVRLLVAHYLSKEKMVIIFDNFEDNQNEKDKTYHNPEMRDFLKALKTNLKNRETFLFFTTRYKLPGLAPDPINVPEFTPNEIKKRYYYGEALSRLDKNAVKQIENTVAKNPRAIDLLNILLNQRFKEGTITTNKVERSTGKLKEILKSGEHPDEKDFSPFILEDLLSCLTQAQLSFLKATAIYRKPVEEAALRKQNIEIDEDTIEYLDSLSLMEWIQTETTCLYYVHRLTAAFLETHFNSEEKNDLHIKAAEYFAGIRNENNQIFLDNAVEAIFHYSKAEQYDQAFEIMNPVQGYLRTHGFTFEALNMVEEFLDYELTDENRAWLFLSYGNVLRSLGKYDQALVSYKDSLDLRKRIGDILGVAKSLHGIGNVFLLKGKFDEALDNYQGALKIFKEVKDISGESKILHQIGMIYEYKGSYDAALAKYEESLEIAKRIGDVSGEAASLHQIGMIYEYKGSYDTALAKYEESLENAKRIGDVSGESRSLHQIGIIYQYKGSYDAALAKYEESLEIAKRIGDVSGEAKSLHQIGRIYELKGSYDAALAKYEESLEIKKRIGDVSGEAKSLHQIGMIYELKGSYDAALAKYEESLEIAKRIGDVSWEARSLHQIGMIYELNGSYDVALTKYEESLEIKKRIRDVNGMALTFGQLGVLCSTLEKYKDALQYFSDAYLIFKKIGSPSASLVLKYIKQMSQHLTAQAFESILKEKGISLEELEQGGAAPNQEEMLRQLVKLYVSLGEEKFVDMLRQKGAPQEEIDQVLPVVKKMVESHE
jgi:tetratricopeptide (TPR) repeat protein